MVAPPSPFTAAEIILPADTPLYRVHDNTRAANEFNPGFGAPTRFAFFGDPTVPVLYAAETEDAAICETLLHSVPFTGGVLRPRSYESRVASKLLVTRPLRLAALLGTGLRTLGVPASEVTETEADRYPETVKWAEAAHAAGFDGVVYMSRRCNSDRVYALFGDRVHEPDLRIQTDYGRVFAVADDRDWLIDYCAPLHVDVLIL
ncbi:RES domain-containing protein [Cryobacterium frigoriphilum]|uniref:RES domain-containing protein n=1 Tax=Cryobacterium frigoriphilum TaxID=1259150 RepID=A0A4R9A1N7_9MICO|nr:RES domain-containing protein [Cryobacterium frigoriphilum]